MDGINMVFDASLYDPSQLAPTHPPYEGPAQIIATDIVPTKENKGGMFTVTFKTDRGEIVKRYNLWNANQVAVDIANRELSALCYATGIFKLNMQTKGAELRGARCGVVISQQKDNEQYTEVSKVLTINGEMPSKNPTVQLGPAPQPQPSPQAQPQAQPWAAPATQPPQHQQTGTAAPAWGAQPQPQAAPAGAPNPNPPWAR